MLARLGIELVCDDDHAIATRACDAAADAQRAGERHLAEFVAWREPVRQDLLAQMIGHLLAQGSVLERSR